jgi:hypothetical protein
LVPAPAGRTDAGVIVNELGDASMRIDRQNDLFLS